MHAEHTAEIPTEFGFTDANIAALTGEGLVAQIRALAD